MAAIIETSDEDPVVFAAKWIGEQLNDTSLAAEVEERLESGRISDALYSLLGRAKGLLAQTSVSDKDIETALTLAVSLTRKLESDRLPSAVEACSTALTGDFSAVPDRPQLRLKLLFVLFNLLPDQKEARLPVLFRIFRFGLLISQADALIPATQQVERWVRDWRLGPADARRLFLAAADASRDSRGKDPFAFLVKCLSTFEGQSDAAEAKEVAARTVLEFLKSPKLFQADLLEMSAIRALESDAKHASLHRLLSIFLLGDLDQFMSFTKDNSSVLEQSGLNQEECISKMRLMSLTALASEAANDEIPYQAIKDALKLNDEEIELWVVKAIMNKVIEARMDQLRQVVVVSRYTQRIFGEEEWRRLRDRLSSWGENIGNVLKTVQSSRANGGLPQGLSSGFSDVMMPRVY
eukprot:jgi/Chlat1/7502/Chrsp61S07019